jgi:hypothetical protein
MGAVMALVEAESLKTPPIQRVDSDHPLLKREEWLRARRTTR